MYTHIEKERKIERLRMRKRKKETEKIKRTEKKDMIIITCFLPLSSY